MVNSGTLNLESKNITVSGNITGAGDLNITFTPSSSGYVNNGTNSSGYTPGGAVTVNPTVTGQVSDQTKFSIIRGQASKNPTISSISATSTALVSWEFSDGTSHVGQTDANSYTIKAEDIVAVYTKKSAYSVAGVSDNAAAPIDIVTGYNGDNTQLISLSNKLTNVVLASSLNAAGEQLQPTNIIGNVQASYNIVDSHLSGIALHNNNSSSFKEEVNSNNLNKYKIWGQIFSAKSNQDKIDNIDGFNTHLIGVALGGHFNFNQSNKVGLAFSSSETDVDSKGVLAGNKSSISSYQGTLYHFYNNSKPWFLDSSFSLSFHRYDDHRIISFDGFSDTLKSRHKGYQYTVKTNAHYPINFEKLSVSPIIGFIYSKLSQDNYSEDSINGSALSVNALDFHSLRSKIGSSFSKEVVAKGAKFIGRFDLSWQHELIRKAVFATARFKSGSNQFNYKGPEIRKDSVLIGLALNTKLNENTLIEIYSNLELRSKYSAQNFMANLKYNF